MDNPNPIYYRDLITPDDSITNLIGQLEEIDIGDVHFQFGNVNVVILM